VANIVENKYYLRTVHEEIDLYDRKLAHLLNFETFATEADRAAATRKLNLKRDALALTAKRRKRLKRARRRALSLLCLRGRTAA